MENICCDDIRVRPILERCGRIKREEIINREISLSTISQEIQEKYKLIEGKIINGAIITK